MGIAARNVECRLVLLEKLLIGPGGRAVAEVDLGPVMAHQVVRDHASEGVSDDHDPVVAGLRVKTTQERDPCLADRLPDADVRRVGVEVTRCVADALDHRGADDGAEEGQDGASPGQLGDDHEVVDTDGDDQSDQCDDRADNSHLGCNHERSERGAYVARPPEELAA